MMSNFPITHIVLHYSATYADQDLGVSDIDKMHKARGWSGVGYHYVIKRDGTVQQGRKENKVGAHVGGQNTGKIGICLIGGLDRATGPNKGVDNRTDAQKKAAASLIRDLLVRYPNAKVLGHRDLAATQCPAYDAAKWWASVSKASLDAPSFNRGVDAVIKPSWLADLINGIIAAIANIFRGKK